MNNNYHSVEDFASDESFQDYIMGNNPAATRKWKTYLRTNPEKASLMEEAGFFINMLSFDQPIIQTKKSSQRSFPFRWILAAACMTSFVLFSISYFHNATQIPTPITKIAEGQNMSIFLTDLSTINLREGSSVRFLPSFEDTDKREIWLEGEAYFDVEKSIENKPFIVHLPKGDIAVLGTKFLVKSDSTSATVILEEGSIDFLTESSSHLLKPGDLLSLNEESLNLIHNKEVEDYDSWRRHELAFKNIKFADLITVLNNSYNLQIQLGNPTLAERKITTTVKENDPMLLLQAIAMIYDIEILEKNNKIILN